MMKRLFLFLCLWLVGMLAAVAQTPTTQGTDFWVSYMRNGHHGSNPQNQNDNCRLIVSASEDCEVTISNDYAGYQRVFSVRAGQVSMETVPSIYAYHTLSEGITYLGIHVTATSEISLYIGNEADNSYDASNVLPVSALGTSYMIQSFNARAASGANYSDDIRASFMVIAVEDGTTVEIIPTATTYNNHPAGEPYTVSLQRGQVYQVKTKNSSPSMTALDGDFSGTRIVANKPVAVFNGNCLTAVPGGPGYTTGYDHVFEQAMPADYWGKKFVVTSSRPPMGVTLGDDEVKITALEDNTVVTKNGNSLFTLNAGESNSITMNLIGEPCAYLEASKPVAVYLYNHSHGTVGTQYGDPSMVWISPVEQTLKAVTFTTFNVQQVENHFVNIVCYTDHCSEMTLDGTNISANFVEVPGNPELSYARCQISHNVHTLRCPGGFIAHVYGIGEAEGYAYSVGSSAKILTKQLYVDEVLSTELPSDYAVCQYEEVRFRVETNYEMDHVRWDFGDNATAQGESVSHTFNASGRFNVRSVIYRMMDGNVQPFDTLSVTIPVNPVKIEHINLISCELTPGDYYDTLQTVLGCDSIIHTHIEAGGINLVTIHETACEEYRFRDSVFTTSGIHEYLVQMDEGCDSLYRFDLTIHSVPENPEISIWRCYFPTYYSGVLITQEGDYHSTYETSEGCLYDSIIHVFLMPPVETFDTIVTCDSYYWDAASQWLTDGGDYSDTLVEGGGCLTIRNLNLTLDLTPLIEIRGLTNVAVATNFWPGEYLYFLSDSSSLTPEDIFWELSDNENGEWVFRPHGFSCTIIAYTMGSKELHVGSVFDNFCNAEDFMTINCSGYDVDETALNLLRVYPNPADDELMVEGEGLKRVVLCNLLGQQLREWACESESRIRIAVGDLPQALYLVRVETRYGNKTQLISVTR